MGKQLMINNVQINNSRFDEDEKSREKNSARL